VASTQKNVILFDSGNFLLDIIYDDVAARITDVIVTNAGVKDYVVSVTCLSNGKQYSFTSLKTVPLISQNVPADAQNKLGYTIGTGGKIGGLKWEVTEA
jgi:hypothetical protein